MEVLGVNLITILIIVGIGSFLVASILALLAFLRPGWSIDRFLLPLLLIGTVPIAAVLISHGIETSRFPALGRFEAFTCYALAIIAVYVHAMRRHRVSGIAAILLPYVTILLIVGAPAAGVAVALPDQWPAVLLNVHIVAAFVAYALFTLASILAVTYLVQDNNLKRKRFGAVFEKLPALETMDHLMRQQVGTGLLMLTISIVAGAVMLHLSGNAQAWLTDPKIAATAAMWIAYAVLMHMRTSADRHGRRLALATIVGLFFLLFTFVGVHLIAESIHDFVLTTAMGN
ncbi:MAG: hypothetical protein E4H02_10790 [Lentisphaerales bacterium]|nr:MAG: hypothetical protein E4H02_10790 [Lentisphaerales bacterium]